MSVKLIPSTFIHSEHDFKNINSWTFISNKHFLWGKASRSEDGNFIGIQGPVSCKDYVVDTYYTTNTGNFSYRTEFKDAIYAPYFYIVCPTIEFKNKIIDRIKSHINAYEKKHGFIPTIAYDVECDFCESEQYNDNFICFEYDPKWMINSTSMSIYLSMVRCLIYTNQIDNFDIIKFENVIGCNEYVYYNNLSPDEKHLISYLYNNPNLFIVDTTKYGYKQSGFYNKGSHGVSGLFFALKQMKIESTYPYNIWYQEAKNNYCNNWLFNIIHKYYTGYTFVEYYDHKDPVGAGIVISHISKPIINIKQGCIKLLEHLTNGGALEYVEPVQSVQQKVVRKRAVKKVCKQGTEGMLLGAM